jgi:ribosome-binding factor A
MSSTRQRRVQELLVHEISVIVQRELKDPRIGFVTITDAEVSPDLRHARVFFSVLGETAQPAETAKALNRAAGFVRSEFARRAQMRYVPEIQFEYDPSVERGARLEQLLRQVRQDEEQSARAGDTGGDTDSERE